MEQILRFLETLGGPGGLVVVGVLVAVLGKWGFGRIIAGIRGRRNDQAEARPLEPAGHAARIRESEAHRKRELADDAIIDEVMSGGSSGDAAADLDAALRSSAGRHGGPGRSNTSSDGTASAPSHGSDSLP